MSAEADLQCEVPGHGKRDWHPGQGRAVWQEVRLCCGRTRRVCTAFRDRIVFAPEEAVLVCEACSGEGPAESMVSFNPWLSELIRADAVMVKALNIDLMCEEAEFGHAAGGRRRAVVYALKTCGCRPAEAWCQRYYEHVSRLLGKFPEQPVKCGSCDWKGRFADSIRFEKTGG